MNFNIPIYIYILHLVIWYTPGIIVHAFYIATGQIKTARWLIDTDIGGTLINMKDSSGDTPAHDAADNG